MFLLIHFESPTLTDGRSNGFHIPAQDRTQCGSRKRQMLFQPGSFGTVNCSCPERKVIGENPHGSTQNLERTMEFILAGS